MPHITTDDLLEYYEGADGLPDIRLEVAVNTAARLVAKYAPPPDPVTSDYTARAFDAELMVSEYLVASRTGIISGYSSPVGSESYSGDVQVRSFVRDTMGPFFGKMKSVPVKSSFPRSYRSSFPWIGNV